MAEPVPPLLDAAALQALASAPAARASGACDRCRPLACRGWESWPATADAGALERIGTLRDPAVDEPTLAEHHPAGTHGWDPEAPIAPAFHPYNRCDVWRCTTCGRPFLRYTEYGGYYEDQRVRELLADRLVDVQP